MALPHPGDASSSDAPDCNAFVKQGSSRLNLVCIDKSTGNRGTGIGERRKLIN